MIVMVFVIMLIQYSCAPSAMMGIQVISAQIAMSDILLNLGVVLRYAKIVMVYVIPAMMKIKLCCVIIVNLVMMY